MSTTEERQKIVRSGPSLLRRDFRRNAAIYAMVAPLLIYYLLFHYGPMYGAIVAFQNYRPARGILESRWVGLENFHAFFRSFYFWRLIRNTVVLSTLDIVFAFPGPIVLALLLNELRHRGVKRVVQTITYMPHFLSVVVVAGLVISLTSRNGAVTSLLGIFGVPRTSLLAHPEYFRGVYVVSEIWQHIGWNSIIFLAALSAIDPNLYSAAMVDGAGRWRQILHITLPGMAPTIMILFILRMGRIMTVGFEKIILMYNPGIYETADVISSFVYRKGLLEQDYSYSAAVGLFNSVLNFSFLIAANALSRRVNDESLW